MVIDKKNNPIEYAAKVVGEDPFASFLGIVVEEVRDSYARVSLEIKPEYCNAEKRTHGSVLFALADQAFAVAANSRGYTAFSLELKINYLQASNLGDIIVSEATALDIRKRISVWNVVLTDQRGTKVAAAQGLAYHFLEGN